MSYKATDIAKKIISLSNPEIGDGISNLKLQKLLYYCQGVYLALNNEPLFDEEIEAWQYGPVVPPVYHEYKDCGSQYIPSLSTAEIEMKAEDFEIIKEVYEVFGQFSALKLMEMTHNENPWAETPVNTIIPKEKISDFFKHKYVSGEN